VPLEVATSEPEAGSARPTLPAIRQDLGDCTRCKLHRGRTNLVFGVGNPHADIVFVGEGPGYYEDQRGEPFVGKAGELLDRIITNVLRLRREDVYICNVVKCRPPRNRDPEPEEVATCSPFLWAQLDAIAPVIVVGLGRFAVQTLLQTTSGIGRLRGRAHPFRDAVLVPTYHPAYLLRNPADKRKTLDDMKLVRSEFAKRTGRKLPSILSREEARDRS
jgi:DNA polymerase